MKTYFRNYNDDELNDKLADFVEKKDIEHYVNETHIGYDENGEILFYFIKNFFSTDEIDVIMPTIEKASTFIVSLGRGHAAGKLDMSQPLWAKGLKNVELKEHNYHNKYTLNPEGISNRKYKLNNPVYSNLVGYYEKPLVNYKKTIKTQPRCRQTQFTARHKDIYSKIIPYMERISGEMAEKLPAHYRKQNHFIQKHRERIGQSCYSTITINKNFRTAIHIDKGDFKDGIGTITTAGDFEGGEFCLVDYKVAINVKPTDLLFVNVHKHHANLPFEGTRYSMVSYVRENIKKCGLKYDYRVVIPSYGRSEVLKQKTLAMLERGGVPKDRIDIWIVKEQLNDYLQYEIDGYRIMEGVKGISKQREFIANYYNENTPLVWFDDDCVGLYEKVLDNISNKYKHKELVDYELYFLKSFDKLWDSGANLMGVYPIRNIGWMKNRITTGLKFCIGSHRINFNKKEYESAGEYQFLEDYERTLKYFIGDGSVLRNEGVYIKHNFWTLDGGIGASQSRTQEDKLKLVKKFVAEYPEYSRIAIKKDTCDIRLKSVKAFDAKKQTYFLFSCDWADEDDINRMIQIYKNMKKQGFKVKIYMYLSTYMLYEPYLYDIYCEGDIEDAENIISIENYIHRNHFIFTGIKIGMIYLKNNKENINKIFKTEKKRNLVNNSIIKFTSDNPILDALNEYIETNRKFDNKTFTKYLEIFDI